MSKISSLQLEAMRQLRAQKLARASELYEKVLQLAPKDEKALAMQAQISLALSDYSQAVGFLQRLIAIQPASPDLYFKQGVALQSLGKVEQAEAAYRKAVTINPDYAVALYNLGTILQAQKNNAEAVAAFERAVASNPKFSLAYYNMGISLRAIGECGAALEAQLSSIKLDPAYAAAHAELASLYQETCELEESLTAYQRAIQLKLDDGGYYSGLGVTLYHMGKHDDAIRSYRKALQIDPKLAKAHWNLSLSYLRLGNFSDGWREYEWRKQCGIAAGRYSLPQWGGSSLQGKTILLHGEQGIGDELMFASCYQDLINAADHVVIECESRLEALFKRSFPDSTVHGASEGNAFEWMACVRPVDCVVAAGSLPKYFRHSIDAYPHTVSYIEPDPMLVKEWKNRLASIGDNVKVGISWRGGSTPLDKGIRSIALNKWAGIFNIKGISFISLQYGNSFEEIAEVVDRYGAMIHTSEDVNQFREMDNFAAQVAALDLVISVDNTTVHMAGSLGVPTWVLLPYAPEWRWLLDCDCSCWYPSARLFRQSQPGTWQDVLDDVEGSLNALACESSRFSG